MNRYFNDEEWLQISRLANFLISNNKGLHQERIVMSIRYDEDYIRKLFKDFKDLEIRVNYDEPDETFFIGDE